MLTSVGLHVEQDHPAYLRSAIQRFYLLENGKWHIRHAAATVCYL